MKQRTYFFLTIALTIFFIFLVIEIAIALPNLKNSYNVAYMDKINLLKEPSSENRLILAGGSNVAMGFDSYKLEECIGNYKVINAGLHAGIGLRDMLEDQYKFARKGDVIVVFPEYSHFSGGYGDVAFWDIVSLRGMQVSDLRLRRFPSACRYSVQKINGAIIRMLQSNKDELLQESIYDRRGFNEKGDYILHWEQKSQDIGVAEIKNKLDDSMFKFIKEFNEKMNHKGIKVIYIPPVYQNSSAEANKEIIEQIEKNMKLINGAFISSPTHYFYNDELFFDTQYHLNKEGVDKRTNQVSKDLKEYLELNKY